jgi:rhodanese-related sulfurtransferase
MSANEFTLPIETDVATVKAKLDTGGNFVLVDCRELDEYELVRIPGAKLVPMSEMESRVGELDAFRNQNVVVHCHHGGRSLRVASWLRQHGFKQAQSMAGGIDQWAQQIDTSMARY